MNSPRAPQNAPNKYTAKNNFLLIRHIPINNSVTLNKTRIFLYRIQTCSVPLLLEYKRSVNPAKAPISDEVIRGHELLNLRARSIDEISSKRYDNPLLAPQHSRFRWLLAQATDRWVHSLAQFCGEEKQHVRELSARIEK